MTLSAIKSRVHRNLSLIFINRKVIKAKKNNGRKMLDIAEHLKTELPGHGFALLAFHIENGETKSDYVSNVDDAFMIKALEMQLSILKSRQTGPSPAILKSGA